LQFYIYITRGIKFIFEDSKEILHLSNSMFSHTSGVIQFTRRFTNDQTAGPLAGGLETYGRQRRPEVRLTAASKAAGRHLNALGGAQDHVFV